MEWFWRDFRVQLTSDVIITMLTEWVNKFSFDWFCYFCRLVLVKIVKMLSSLWSGFITSDFKESLEWVNCIWSERCVFSLQIHSKVLIHSLLISLLQEWSVLLFVDWEAVILNWISCVNFYSIFTHLSQDQVIRNMLQ